MRRSYLSEGVKTKNSQLTTQKELPAERLQISL